MSDSKAHRYPSWWHCATCARHLLFCGGPEDGRGGRDHRLPLLLNARAFWSCLPFFAVTRPYDEHSPSAVWCHLNAPQRQILTMAACFPCLASFQWPRQEGPRTLLPESSASIAVPRATLEPSWLSEGDHPCVDFNIIIIIICGCETS